MGKLGYKAGQGFCMEKSLLNGWGGKEAVSGSGPNEKSLQDFSGKVWVENGKVCVGVPSENGRAPTITPCAGVDLFVNGNKVEEKTSVGENDEIIIKPHLHEEPGAYKIKIAPGGLEAVLELRTGTVSTYSVQDCGPRKDLVLSAVKIIEKKCPFDLAGIMREIAGKNIVYGIRHDEIRAILDRPEDGLYVIARGDPPGESVDERVELKFAAGREEPKAGAVTGKDRIDFRDLVEIPSVEPGALLAVKLPGAPGAPGKTVTGEIIPPRKPVVFELIAGKGAEVLADGSKVYARIGGRPVAKKLGNKYVIDVDPVLHKKGDVDISSGNIRFKGDVVVHGNVCEGMTVQAAGRINITGMVFGARIAAQGNISVGQNVAGSHIVAGGNNIFFREVNKILAKLQAGFSELLKMVPALAEHPKLKNVNAGQLVQLLIDRKYPGIPGLISEMVRLSSQNSFILPREMVHLLEKIEKNLLGLNLMKVKTVEEFGSFLSEIGQVRQIIDGMAGDKASITFSYSENSTIEASGDVSVSGGGCINTVIRAGGNVRVKGVFRGGEIAAGGDVILNETGSEIGARTLIKTGEGKKVFIKKAYEGVQIQIGSRKANITSLQHNIRAELDETGDLIIS